FLISVAPLADACFVFPTGPPWSAKLALFFFIHASHSPILFFLSSALVLAIIFCISAISIRYKARNVFMGFPLCRSVVDHQLSSQFEIAIQLFFLPLAMN